jgi:hypothetical protein
MGRILALSIAAACLMLFFISLPARLEYLSRLADKSLLTLISQTNLNIVFLIGFLRNYPSLALGIEISVMGIYFAGAALLYRLRSNEWLALLTIAALPSFALHIIPTLNTWMSAGEAQLYIGIMFKGLGLGLAFLFLYLFPGGFYTPPWMRLFLPAWIVWVVLWIFFPNSILSFRDPYNIRVMGFVLLMFWWGTGIASQIYRYYRISGPVERQQTKYVTFGATIVLLAYSLYVPLRELMGALARPVAALTVFQLVAPYIFILMIGAIPITITVSILRYRLWDVDIFIRRTLVYTTLTVTLLVIYAVLVFVLQAIFIGWLANASEVVLIITTLAVAGLINPLRKRIQRDIDRRFYRRNYDAQKILEAFGASTRSQANLNVLTKELIRVVQETLQPESVSLWLQNYVPNPDSTISQNAQPGTHSKSET